MAEKIKMTGRRLRFFKKAKPMMNMPRSSTVRRATERCVPKIDNDGASSTLKRGAFSKASPSFISILSCNIKGISKGLGHLATSNTPGIIVVLIVKLFLILLKLKK